MKMKKKKNPQKNSAIVEAIKSELKVNQSARRLLWPANLKGATMLGTFGLSFIKSGIILDQKMNPWGTNHFVMLCENGKLASCLHNLCFLLENK